MLDNRGSISQDKGQLERKKLPDAHWGSFWSEIVIDPVWRQCLQNYAYLFVSGGLKDYNGSGILLFQGPPGTGKSSLAKGYANFVAEKFTESPSVYAYEVNAASWRSYRLGEAPKLVELAFSTIRMAARHFPTILIVDEVETIAVSRKRTLAAPEPSDVISAVDELLKQVDQLQSEYDVLIIATSNLIGAIDEAVLSRVDLQVPFQLPDENNRAVILERKVKSLRKRGHHLSESDLRKIASATEGFSGRELSKLPLKARIRINGNSNLTVDDYLRAIEVTSQ